MERQRGISEKKLLEREKAIEAMREEFARTREHHKGLFIANVM